MASSKSKPVEEGTVADPDAVAAPFDPRTPTEQANAEGHAAAVAAAQAALDSGEVEFDPTNHLHVLATGADA